MPGSPAKAPRLPVGWRAGPRSRLTLPRALVAYAVLVQRQRRGRRLRPPVLSAYQVRLCLALSGVAALFALAGLALGGYPVAVAVGIFSLLGLWLFPLPALHQGEKLAEGEGFGERGSPLDRLRVLVERAWAVRPWRRAPVRLATRRR